MLTDIVNGNKITKNVTIDHSFSTTVQFSEKLTLKNEYVGKIA